MLGVGVSCSRCELAIRLFGSELQKLTRLASGRGSGRLEFKLTLRASSH